MAFTAAMDALITANLVHETCLFQIQTFGVDSRKVLSDIGIDIATDATVESLQSTQKRLTGLAVCLWWLSLRYASISAAYGMPDIGLQSKDQSRQHLEWDHCISPCERH
ncbi:hypothetical protein P4S64_16060 [Vibrio sp. M60_M31a]